MSGRPADGWATLGAALARVLSTDAPAWLSASTRACADLLLTHLQHDVGAVVAAHSTREAHDVLGCGRAAVMRWRRGWLA